MPTATATRPPTRKAQTQPRAQSRRVPTGRSTVTIKQAISQALAASPTPMTTKDITTAVLNMRHSPLGGNTPAATVAAILSTEHKKRGAFRRVAPGTYALRRKPGRKPRTAR